VETPNDNVKGFNADEGLKQNIEKLILYIGKQLK